VTARDDNETFLGRWSRLKRDQEKAPNGGQAASAVPQKQGEAPPPLPPVETLTPQSDFTGFMQPQVQDALRRVALKKLFKDPQFNVPDPFEPFSGDWTGGEAISSELMKQLHQARTHVFSAEERQEYEAEQLERDHVEALAYDAERSAMQETKESELDEPGRKDA
jgi:hypothetical protein